MKSVDSTLWIQPNTGATNESGFTAIPGGWRCHALFSGEFRGIGGYTYFWCSGGEENNEMYARHLRYNNARIIQEVLTNLPMGLSVRCIKDE
ncbi:hypothetical protein GF407_15775 [candidate division KSB1 bacterium]|nr:hypothetical protein [candidate division KSB1 bacterium]